MSGFAPGDEVLAVGYDGSDAESPPDNADLANIPVRGTHYIVRAIDCEGGLLLEGVINGLGPAQREWSWNPRNFRPVKRDSIELFRKMCTSTKPLVEA